MHNHTFHRALASFAKGGKLWGLRPEEFCCILWAFAHANWQDAQLYWDMVQVANLRTDEFDSASCMNLLAAIALLRTPGLVDTKGFDEDIDRLLSFLEQGIASGAIAPPDAGAHRMAMRALALPGGLTAGAERLLHRDASDLNAYAPLMLAAEDARLQARVCLGVAQDILCADHVDHEGVAVAARSPVSRNFGRTCGAHMGLSDLDDASSVRLRRWRGGCFSKSRGDTADRVETSRLGLPSPLAGPWRGYMPLGGRTHPPTPPFANLWSGRGPPARCRPPSAHLQPAASISSAIGRPPAQRTTRSAM